ncbi:formylglycine-generating enzyme family protein [Spirochaeta isovalerica]|uniref:Formylglycine-generating enzyme required for sulfatase activity n=1 Tax=Spirochaeta isovalerica TaxID=150 RepID=A0A841RAS1_9SPIO|nr:SUMF1/EgtB/PvdO family nonheme iron enzyme [Spirochaeta isovalerica]MBB6482484.1 formylglycine-generating enzyme required for sulfatase activity [Spirochaeta isovalerica]
MSCLNKEEKAIHLALEKLEMVLVEKGEFDMGRNGGSNNEGPEHRVKIENSFYISAHEITFELYDLYAQEKKKSLPKDNGWGRGKMPVINITWMNMTAFCNWLSEKADLNPCYTMMTCDFSKNGFRLPTEAEWEFAARGGNNSLGYLFSGGNISNEVAWTSENTDRNMETGLKKPNELGIYDMSGNVWEFCFDWYKEAYYQSSPIGFPIGPEKKEIDTTYGGEKVRRGGSITYAPEYARTTFRSAEKTNYGDFGIGFRIVRNAE